MNVHFGHTVFANFKLTLVDDTHIYQDYQYNQPVHIGENCWIGAGAVILPDVAIVENTVIGAGSVITKDIPANVAAVGMPCTVMRGFFLCIQNTLFCNDTAQMTVSEIQML